MPAPVRSSTATGHIRPGRRAAPASSQETRPLCSRTGNPLAGGERGHELVRNARPRRAPGIRSPSLSARMERTGFLRSIPRAVAAALAPLLLALAACGGADARDPSTASAAVQVTDDAGETVRLDAPARRIVSLVPSATETLVALGAGDRIVGRTDYDAAPEVAHVPSVGGGIDPGMETLASLRPDLVVGWASQGGSPLRDQLRALGIPLLTVATEDTADIHRAITHLGALTGRGAAADSLARGLRASLDSVRASVAGRPTRSVFFVVGDDPVMTAGPGTFIHQLLETAGARNVFADAGQRWPQVSMEELVRRQPELILVPRYGDGDPAKALAGRPGWRELRAVREGRVVVVPADVVNRPGPAIGRSARILRDAIHPEAGEG